MDAVASLAAGDRRRGQDVPGGAFLSVVDVSKVEVLELRVRGEGGTWGSHAVWVEPRLFTDRAAAEREAPAERPRLGCPECPRPGTIVLSPGRSAPLQSRDRQGAALPAP